MPEIVRFFKAFKMWVFFEKMDRFFKNNLNFFEIPKGGKFAVECVSNGIVSQKCHFHPNHEVFLAKSLKTLKVGKTKKNMMKKEFF